MYTTKVFEKKTCPKCEGHGTHSHPYWDEWEKSNPISQPTKETMAWFIEHYGPKIWDKDKGQYVIPPEEVQCQECEDGIAEVMVMSTGNAPVHQEDGPVHIISPHEDRINIDGTAINDELYWFSKYTRMKMIGLSDGTILEATKDETIALSIKEKGKCRVEKINGEIVVIGEIDWIGIFDQVL